MTNNTKIRSENRERDKKNNKPSKKILEVNYKNNNRTTKNWNKFLMIKFLTTKKLKNSNNFKLTRKKNLI